MTRQSVVVLRVVGVLLALGVVAALVGPAVTSLLQRTEETSYELADPTRLVVDGDVGSVAVRAAQPGESSGAHVRTRSGFTDPVLGVTDRAGAATLSSSCSTSWFDRCEVHWEVVVPAGTDVTVVLAVGDVTVTGTTASLDLRTDVGDVTAEDASGEHLSLGSDVGDVSLHALRPPQQVTAGTATGSATVTVPDDGTGYRVSATTSVGGVTNEIGSDPDAARSIEVSTSVGDVAVLRDRP